MTATGTALSGAGRGPPACPCVGPSRHCSKHEGDWNNIRRLEPKLGFEVSKNVSSNRPISEYRLGEMSILSFGQSVSVPRGKAGARLNAHTQLRSVSARHRKRCTEIGLFLAGPTRRSTARAPPSTAPAHPHRPARTAAPSSPPSCSPPPRRRGS